MEVAVPRGHNLPALRLTHNEDATLMTMKDEAKLAAGITILGTPVGADAVDASVLKAKMTSFDSLPTAVESVADPHISTHMHRLCASAIPVVHIFRATCPSQILTLTAEFDKTKKDWMNGLLLTSQFCPRIRFARPRSTCRAMV